jgi:hypothetical protein
MWLICQEEEIYMCIGLVEWRGLKADGIEGLEMELMHMCFPLSIKEQ